MKIRCENIETKKYNMRNYKVESKNIYGGGFFKKIRIVRFQKRKKKRVNY